MLTIHTSNQLEHLKNQFASAVRQPLSNVFTTEMVVVQNAGMARWLSMEMANIAGISANTEFLFPAEFMWRLLRLISPDIPEKSECTPATMQFHITQELTQNYADYPELQHYILNNGNINQSAIWDLAGQLSQLLDQYLFYRSSWIRDWESKDWDTSKHWQSRLWQRCVQDKGLLHWLNLQDQFKHSLDEFEIKRLPERISFFSMAALSPGYIDLLGELAQKTEIHVYIINPCEDIYWGDIRSEKSRSKLAKDQQILTDVGNPLLASMGKQGRDFIFKLFEIPNHINPPNEQSERSQPDTLLNQIQQDIYDLEKPTTLSEAFLSDSSIHFNACHTAMREVEVLHDQILSELDADSNLAPSDIVVMMPDIENYAPYIDAVFGTSKQHLPFSIADREAQNVFSIIEALNKLFALPDTRFDVESVFELLEYNDIRENFQLDEDQLSYCRDLARSTNIRWGISAKNRANSNLPDTEEHTWKYALDRMLLGYAMAESGIGENNTDVLFATERKLPLLAYNEIEGSTALILSNFKRFSDAIFTISKWQYQTHTLEKWLEHTRQLIKQMTPENSDQQQILKAMAELESNSNLAEFSLELPFNVYQRSLKQCLQGISSSEKYLGYGITFCALVPMRSVPFKVVALMGMNDGQYPRQDQRPSFDLMANQPQAGDRSRRDEDRYLFLESILAARSKLIISYIGQSVKDNSELPPSVLVSELLDCISIYSDKPSEDWIVKHPLQAFSPRYFSQNKDSAELFSYAEEYTALQKSGDTPSTQFIKEPLEELDDSYKNISLNELIAFFKSPSRAFLKQRFSIQTFDEDTTLPIREPFALESFKDAEIRNLIMECANNSEHSITDKHTIARAKGLLPYAEIGDEIFQKERRITETFISQLPETETNQSRHFSLSLSGFQLHGTLDHLTDQGRFVQQVSKPYAGDYISLWLNHLILNIEEDSDAERHTSFYSPELKFSLKPVANASEILSRLLSYYWQGLHYPLQFFPKCSFDLFKSGIEKSTDASSKWNGNDLFTGEKDNFENWLLHRDLDMDKDNLPEDFLHISREFFGTLFEHLEEI